MKVPIWLSAIISHVVSIIGSALVIIFLFALYFTLFNPLKELEDVDTGAGVALGPIYLMCMYAIGAPLFVSFPLALLACKIQRHTRLSIWAMPFVAFAALLVVRVLIYLFHILHLPTLFYVGEPMLWLSNAFSLSICFTIYWFIFLFFMRYVFKQRSHQ